MHLYKNIINITNIFYISMEYFIPKLLLDPNNFCIHATVYHKTSIFVCYSIHLFFLYN